MKKKRLVPPQYEPFFLKNLSKKLVENTPKTDGRTTAVFDNTNFRFFIPTVKFCLLKNSRNSTYFTKPKI